MKKIKVVLADDHSIIRQSLAKVLSDYEDIDIVGLASDANELYQLAYQTKPDIIISDIDMPGKSLFEVLPDIQENVIDAKVLILTMHETPEYVFQALGSGVSGYLTKFSEKEELIKAIRLIYEGKEYYSQEITEIIVKEIKEKSDIQVYNPLKKLSKREKEILKLLAEGNKTKDIAEKLFISERTVSNHRANILAKCQVSNTAELLKFYYRYST